MKKLLLLIGCFFSLSLMAGNPVLEAHVCQADKFLAGCDVFSRADGDKTGVPVDIGGTTYDLYLSWGTPTEFAYEDSMVVGGKYIFNCQTLTKAGEYRDTLVTATGCDSIVVLTLTEYTPVPPCKDTTVEYTDSVAVGGKYIFNCQTLTGAGEYRDTLVKADGCDSIVVLTLTEYTPYIPPVVVHDTVYQDSTNVEPFPYEYVFVSRLQTVTLHQDTAFADTIRDIPMSDVLIRDSIYRYNLTVLPKPQPVVVHDTVSVDSIDAFCRGTIFVSRLQTITLNQDTSWADTVKNIIMSDLLIRDSIYNYSIGVHLPTTGDTTATVCQGERLIWHGKTAKDGLTWTTTNAAGCDSIVTLHLTTLLPSASDTTAYVCKGEMFYWHGKFGYEGAKWKTTNVAGCDSIVTLHVETSPTWVDDLPAYAKDNDWLLMIDRKQLREQYDMEPTEDQVHWYKKRVNGFIFLGTGYYFTNGQPLEGDYYARLVGIDLSPLGSCVAEARTITLHCGTETRALTLAPTMVGAGEPMVLSNLDATQESTIVIYNAAGSAMRSFRVQGTETFHLNAEETSGIYLMHVENAHQSTTLKFIVNQ